MKPGTSIAIEGGRPHCVVTVFPKKFQIELFSLSFRYVKLNHLVTKPMILHPTTKLQKEKSKSKYVSCSLIPMVIFNKEEPPPFRDIQ
jgi:hypothetical protein